MDSFPCQMQECRRFKSQIHSDLACDFCTPAVQGLYYWFVYNSSNTGKCNIHYVDVFRLLTFAASLVTQDNHG